MPPGLRSGARPPGESVMTGFGEALRGLARAIWDVLRTLLLGLPFLIRWLLRRLRGGRKRPRKRPEECVEIPHHVRRRPDPCLYSQQYLQAQGLPVTWNNPDIWLTETDGTPVPSGSLEPGHDYVVHGRIHDASFDPALGTTVTCRFRNWGFSGSQFEPVDVDALGNERVVALHIAPWSAEVAEFRWRTPDQAGHYCIRVECSHPEDREPGNNIGQENTNVVAPDTSDELTARALIANFSRTERDVRFLTDGYTIPTDEVELRLDTWRQPIRDNRISLGHATLGRAEGVSRLRAPTGSTHRDQVRGPTFVGYAYRGRERVIAANERGQAPPDAERIELSVDGTEIDRLRLAPGEEREVDIRIIGAGSGVVNINALDQYGQLIGGVTVTRGGA